MKPHIVMVRATDVGAARHIVTLANYLASAGFDVTLVCLEGSPSAASGLSASVRGVGLGTPPLPGWGRLSGRIQAAIRLRRALTLLRADILYVIDSWTLPVVWLATGGLWAWGRSRLVYHTFDWLDPALHGAVPRAFERAACRRADLVVNTDRARARLQRSVYRLRATPLWVQNSLPLLTPRPPPDAALRRRLAGGGRSDLEFIVIYPTTVWNEASSQRMTRQLIEAFALLPDSYHLATFWRDGAEYRRCARLVEEKKLADRVTFLSPVPFPALLACVASADLGAVLYDDAKSAGYFMANPDKLSLLIAGGVPYVASDFPNLQAVTYRYDLGLCCDSRDPREIARALRELAEGRPPLSERKDHVRRMFEERLHFEKGGAILVDALRALRP